MIRLAGWIIAVIAAIALLGLAFQPAEPRDPGRPERTGAPETGRYANCEAAVAAAGPGPHREGTPGYDPYLDRDADGVSCEE